MHTYEMDTEHFANPNLRMVVCGVRLYLYFISVNRNSGLDGRIFYCFITSMAAVQADDVRSSLMFMSDLNGNRQEGLGSKTQPIVMVLIVMVLQPLTLKLCLDEISWLSARPMYVVEHLTS